MVSTETPRLCNSSSMPRRPTPNLPGDSYRTRLIFADRVATDAVADSLLAAVGGRWGQDRRLIRHAPFSQRQMT
jgi:hypothetical protein